MYRHIVTILSYVLFNTGCYSVKPASDNTQLVAVTFTNRKILEGNYYNKALSSPIDSMSPSTYDAEALRRLDLCQQFFLLSDETPEYPESVEILCPDRHALLVQCTDVNSDSNRIEVRGRYKKGYFVTHKYRRTEMPPLPPFYYFNTHVRFYLTTDRNGRLVVFRRGARSGMLFFMANSFSMNKTLIFPPVNE